jgi:hypothetical protein
MTTTASCRQDLDFGHTTHLPAGQRSRRDRRSALRPAAQVTTMSLPLPDQRALTPAGSWTCAKKLPQIYANCRDNAGTTD